MINSHLLYQLSYRGRESRIVAVLMLIVNRFCKKSFVLSVDDQVRWSACEQIAHALHRFLQIFHAGGERQSGVSFGTEG